MSAPDALDLFADNPPTATNQDRARLALLGRQLDVLAREAGTLLRRNSPADVFVILGSGLNQEHAVELLTAAIIRLAQNDARP